MEINHFMIRWQHEENYPSTNVRKPPGRENDPGQEQEHEDTSQRQTAHIQAALCVGRTLVTLSPGSYPTRKKAFLTEVSLASTSDEMYEKAFISSQVQSSYWVIYFHPAQKFHCWLPSRI